MRRRAPGNSNVKLELIRRIAAIAAAAAVLVGTAPAQRAAKPETLRKLRAYDSPYYVIHTDLDMDTVREAYGRLTTMAKEYHRRTKSFAGAIRRKFDFHLFSSAEDYYAAGGLAGSAGVYTGRRLMARADEKIGRGVWQVVQHEGWHQFADKVIGGKLPIWVNEGLAEYFGQAIWTGDGFVTGVIPPGRLKRVQKLIRRGKMLGVLDMMRMSHTEWNGQLASRNYDQAWSMCHFLIHGDDGKYKDAFESFISDLSRGRPWRQAFQARLGRNVTAFQKRYNKWWLALDGEATRDLYVQSVVQTLTSYLARAQVLKLKFKGDVKAFFGAAREGKIQVDPKRHRKLWLPPSLLADALKQAEGLAEWSLTSQKGLLRLRLRLPDGATFLGRFVLRGARPPEVKVEVVRQRTESAPGPSPATQASGRGE